MFTKNLDRIATFEAWLKGLDTDKVAVIHHTDPDGVCSGVIISKVVERVRGKPIDLRINQQSNEVSIIPETVEKLKEAGITLLITTDLVVDERYGTINAIEQFARIIVLDHHQIRHDLQSSRCLFLKAQNISEIEPSQYCSGKLCYDLGARLTDVSDLDWIAAIAIICDFGFKTWTDFLITVTKKYGLPPADNWFESMLGKIGNMISEAEAYSADKAAVAFRDISKAKHPTDLLVSELAKVAAEVDKEIKDWAQHYPERLESYPEKQLLFGFVDTKFNIKSNLSNLISVKHPETTLVLVGPLKDGKLGVSARRQDKKVPMNILLNRATEGLKDASGGGHIPAAGATIRREDLAEFKRRVVSILGQI